MATIKVFSPNGVKELKCFDTLEQVPYMDDLEDIEIPEEFLNDLEAE